MLKKFIVLVMVMIAVLGFMYIVGTSALSLLLNVNSKSGESQGGQASIVSTICTQNAIADNYDCVLASGGKKRKVTLRGETYCCSGQYPNCTATRC